MSEEEKHARDVERPTGESLETFERELEGSSAQRPGAAVPLTRSAVELTGADLDDEDELEIDLDSAAYDDSESLSDIGQSTWLLRLVELLLATAILYLFL